MTKIINSNDKGRNNLNEQVINLYKKQRYVKKSSK